MHSSEVRTKYLEFFKGKDHPIVRSDCLIPSNDPTLLFTSAGMVQFKDNFLGRAGDNLTRAASCQKCFRTTDIENVGYTARHHSFFEMLGNFSFGDYFKREAIHWAWEFVTEVLKLDPARLYPTVFESDDDAFAIWEHEIGVAADRIQRLGRKDNFWGPVGGTGPCGPCSEILYDQGPEIEEQDDRYLEIWNLVFPQYDAQPGETPDNYSEMDNKGVDTGAGLERITAVMQGVKTNFETDLFEPYIKHLEDLTGKGFGTDHATTCAMRVVADHVRGATLVITDRVVPSNVGRGYVVRRIMRRAMVHGQRLGLNCGFFAEMVPLVVQKMGEVYPELGDAQEHVQRVVAAEEEAFHRTLTRGSQILNELIADMEASGRKELPGSEAFRLYDTYGFPLELTLEILQEHGLRCSEEEFEQQMDAQRSRAKSAWKGSGMQALAEAEGIEELAPTEFLGYEHLSASATVVQMYRDGIAVPTLGEGETGAVVLNQTPFYAESGGQVGDHGVIQATGLEIEVTDTQKSANGVYLHYGTIIQGQISTGSEVAAVVSANRRERLIPNHTGTHLLHAALRKVLGDHVHQQGSSVTPEGLRFDFSHPEALTPAEKGEIESLVNQWVRDNLPVETRETSLEEARAAGAMALFGEKYGDRVRMVNIAPVSLELCGGTHCSRTGQLGTFLITSEESIQAGVRRITAVSGATAYEYLKQREALLDEATSLLRCTPAELPDRIAKVQAQLKEKDKQIQDLQSRGSGTSAAELAGQAVPLDLDGTSAKGLVAKVDVPSAAALEALADQLRPQVGSGVIVLGAKLEDKLNFVCVVSKDLTQNLKAGDLVKQVAAVAGGGGGGRPDWAKAGGKDVNQLEAALSKARGLLGI